MKFRCHSRTSKSSVIVYRRTWLRAKYDLKHEHCSLYDTSRDTRTPLLQLITTVFSAYKAHFPAEYEIKCYIRLDMKLLFIFC